MRSRKTSVNPARTPGQLEPGHPWGDVPTPAGSTFVGWVLVQMWEPTRQNSGIVTNWCGGAERVLPAAAEHLKRLSREVRSA